VIAYVDEAASAQLSRRRYYLEAEALQRRLEGGLLRSPGGERGPQGPGRVGPS
jgi:hypothetical protein